MGSSSPIDGFIKKYKSLPGRALNAVEHPVDTLESALGINQPKPAPDPYMLHNDPDIAAANASFRNQAAAAPTTARNNDTPMGKMVRGALSKK